MIMQFTLAESNTPIFINTDHIISFRGATSEGKSITIMKISDKLRDIIVTDLAENIFENYCGQKMTYQ